MRYAFFCEARWRVGSTRFGACAKLVRQRQTAAQALNARPRPPNSSGDLWDAAEARMRRFSACAKLARRRHAWPKAFTARAHSRSRPTFSAASVCWKLDCTACNGGSFRLGRSGR